MSSYYRIATDIDLPKEERQQAAGFNRFKETKFKTHREACEALKTLPENHLFKVYLIFPAMNPL